MRDVTIWHNPRCSKSRQALALLESEGVTPTVRRYLDDPPSAAAIAAVVDALGCAPRALMRTKEARYRELGLAAVDDPAALIEAMAAEPILIERPVILASGRAVIGRPPERALEVLGDDTSA
ncbi:MAG: arsenate reductase (glutaredoxin) [Nannocystaceae bacterium]